MANENEIKFVARGYRELEARLASVAWKDIDQGYLNPCNRVRRITYPDGSHVHYLTFKQRLPNGHNLELEPEITPQDFDHAWEHTNERLRKRRLSIPSDDVLWDIDFYRWSQPYFVLVEVEMPVEMQRPAVILPDLRPYIVFEVPRDDGRFAARRLADEAHVRAVAKDLGLA